MMRRVLLVPISIIACGLIMAQAVSGQPADQKRLVDEAWRKVELASNAFENVLAKEQDPNDRTLKRQIAGKLAEVAAALKEFRLLLAADDPRRWEAKLLELQLSGFHAYAGQPEREPDSAALAKEIAAAPDASAQVKEVASFVQLMLPIMKGPSFVEMTAQDRSDWRRAGHEHLQAYPDMRNNLQLKKMLNAVDTDGDTPMPSEVSADVAWQKLQVAMGLLKQARKQWFDINSDHYEATDRLTKNHASFHAAFADFIAIAPGDPRRWEAKATQLDMHGWHEKTGHPELELDAEILIESILAAPDAGELLKEDASCIYVALILAFHKTKGLGTVRGRRHWRTVAQQHLSRFPKCARNGVIRTAIESLPRLDAADAKKTWQNIEDIMESIRRPPPEVIGNVAKVREYLTKTLRAYDTALQEFHELAPSDPRRWDVKTFDLEMAVMMPFLRRPGREPNVPSVAREILEAPDATKETKGNANAFRLLMTARSWKTVEEIPAIDKQQWMRAADEHLKEYPDCLHNSNISQVLEAMDTKARR